MSRFKGWPERKAYLGIEGAREFVSDWSDAWDDWELEVDALIDAGDEVVAIVRQRGRSKSTGLVVDMEFAQVWSVRDGLQMGMVMYADPAEALDAVGLSE
jgi:ketosteroid isomerase-like protein